MRKSFLVMFFVGAMWDAATTLYGTNELMGGSSFFQIVASFVFAVVILAFISGTLWIWRLKGALGKGFKGAWIAAILFDTFTSIIGNVDLLFGSNLNFSRLLLLVGLTGFMVISPIAWAWVYEQPESRF